MEFFDYSNSGNRFFPFLYIQIVLRFNNATLKVSKNVICGHLIPAGTGLREYDNLTVRGKDDNIDQVLEADIISEFSGR